MSISTWINGVSIDADDFNEMVRGGESNTVVCACRFSSASETLLSAAGFSSVASGGSNTWVFTLTAGFGSKYTCQVNLEQGASDTWTYRSSMTANNVTVTLAGGTGAYYIDVMAMGV